MLAVLLGVLLWMNKKDEDKKSAELQALNAKLYQEEQEKEAALKQNLSAICRLGISTKLLNHFDQVLKVIVQTDIAGVHDDKLAI